jgi:hypothetical protein
MLDNSLWPAAFKLQHFLARQNIANCIIGGIAVNRWGEPRVTSDVDATHGRLWKRTFNVRQGKALARDLIMDELKPLAELKEEP